MATSYKECSRKDESPNVVVSKDGEGNFTTLTEAVNAIPSSATGRYVIYVKSGVYEENVTISRAEVTLIGDGKGKTVFCSQLNSHDDHVSIQDSGAVIVLANNFIAKSITFENTSGEYKGQAVALRSENDKSVFYQCEFIGNQDTLYVNGGRQLFRECDIYGTVDFIFGDASMVVQKCNIYIRGFGYMTAQGRVDKSKNTGISVHKCNIKATHEFDPNVDKAYLGRPWKEYSRVIVMRCYIDSVIDPAGWKDWDGREETAEYMEYDNCGSGSNTKNRVKWPGYKVLSDDNEARSYSVAEFIDGNQWLPATGVPFDPDV